jgi:murein DD-endopeptidase MepM/ murein hydrolase activator NlpD
VFADGSSRRWSRRSRLGRVVPLGLSAFLFLSAADAAPSRDRQTRAPRPSKMVTRAEPDAATRHSISDRLRGDDRGGRRPRTEVRANRRSAGLLWPVDGRVTSRFGERRLWARHGGVDIKAPRGTPIRAAAAGTVVFSGRQSSYGRMIKIAHPDGRTTLYAHNHTNLVRTGDRVKAGAIIGTVGRTGRATANHVHFEVRRGARAQDPLPQLAAAPPSLAKDTGSRKVARTEARPGTKVANSGAQPATSVTEPGTRVASATGR